MKRFIKSRSTQIVSALTLVMALVLSLSVPAMAKSRDKGITETPKNFQMHSIKGKVNLVASNSLSFVVAENATSTITIKVDSNTKYYMVKAGQYAKGIKDQVQQRVQDFKNNGPNNDEVYSAICNSELEQGLLRNWQGHRNAFDKIKSWFGGWRGFGEKAAFSDLEIGDGVIVQVMPNETLAKQVLIVKPSNIKKISGTIQSITGNTFIVRPDSGTDIILTIDSNTIVELKGSMGLSGGQWVSVVYKVPVSGSNLAITVKATLQKPTP